MRNTPPLSGAVRVNKIVRAYSDNRALDSNEFFLIYLATHTPPALNEPEELRKTRARIRSAKLASNHLMQEDLPPILESLSHEPICGDCLYPISQCEHRDTGE
jgi:hypothetical protein